LPVKQNASVSALCLFALVLLVIPVERSTAQSPDAHPNPIFTDVTKNAGIAWRQFSGTSADRFLIETMGGGVAFLDFDGDGLLDIFLVNGGETPHGKSLSPVRNALYRNLGNGKFEEVAAKAGVERINFYGMGVTAADFDNDGFTDLYITGYPSSALFHNNGNGTFTEVTEQAGVANVGRWAAGAAWLDIDRDGRLDLIVTNYAQFSFDDEKKCSINGVRAYCAQTAYTGVPLTLYHNDGHGKFSDISERSGVAKFVGRALGVVALDVNDDGWTDLFIARDASPNLLLINQKNGTFLDTAPDAEIAYDAAGMAKAGMGVDAADVNGDGRPDFVITNFNDQYHSLLVSTSSDVYQDQTTQSNLARYTKKFVGWGIHYIDFDNDGNLDLLIVNGHINEGVERARVDIQYKEPPLLLRNDGSGAFLDMRDKAGLTFQTNYSARGLAVGDWNNDGHTDAVFTCLDAPPVLLRNDTGRDRRWIGFELQGTASNRDAIGARITVEAGRKKSVRQIVGGSSYLSSHDKRVVIGLGSGEGLSTVTAEIRWPNGNLQRVINLKIGRYHHIAEQRTPPGLRP
jgi:hypothetical protein